MRIKGRITRLVRDQGFGFIRAAQGDHCFHSSALRGALFEDLVGAKRSRSRRRRRTQPARRRRSTRIARFDESAAAGSVPDLPDVPTDIYLDCRRTDPKRLETWIHAEDAEAVSVVQTLSE